MLLYSVEFVFSTPSFDIYLFHIFLVFLLALLLFFNDKLGLTFCNPMDCSKPRFLALHYLPEFAQTRNAL